MPGPPGPHPPSHPRPPAVPLRAGLRLTAEPGRRVLVSAELAAIHGGRFDALGEFAFKGVGEKRAVYTPAARE